MLVLLDIFGKFLLAIEIKIAHKNAENLKKRRNDLIRFEPMEPIYPRKISILPTMPRHIL